MLRRFQRESTLAAGLALAQLAFCTYRAVHQSVNLDEAYTFATYLEHPWGGIYGRYDANNHVLFSILAKLSIWLFGLSELSFRLPSLIGGFFMILGAFQVLRLATDSKLVRWIALLAFSLHPLLLDFSVAARGYGISVALLVWAIYFAMRQWYALTGVMLGLALSANLGLAFSVVGLIVAVLLFEDRPWRDRLRTLAVIVASAESVFVLICFGALRTAHRSNFYVGTARFAESIRSLIHFSLNADGPKELMESEPGMYVTLLLLLPAVAVFILFAAGIDIFRNAKERRRLIPFVTLIVVILGMVAGHYAIDLNYPLDRMGVHLFVLFGLVWAIAADAVPRFRTANIILASLLVIRFAMQLQVSRFTVWPAQDNNRTIAETIDRASAGRPSGSVRVTSSWQRWASLEFYRLRLPIPQLQPVPWTDPKDGYDLYVIEDPDRKLLTTPKRVLFSDARTEVAILTDQNPLKESDSGK